ncbi:MAG: cytidine deaminase [Dorea sp.]|nr:cytidine deaminase [Dorea sp.]
MYTLTEKDYELIAQARKAIRLNYDEINYNHTVGAAVRCRNGKIYTGVNVYSLHGACGEQVAIGTAVTQGERDFEAIVAVRGKEGEEIVPPCGNCRQMLFDYMPECDVILFIDGEEKKVKAKELLPFAYSVEA